MTIESPVDKALRAFVRGIANPLKLGEMGLDATHFVIGQHWKNHFTRKVAEAGLTATTGVEVRQLRKWINEPKPMGLPKEAENLVILIYALQTNQSFFIHECTVYRPELEQSARLAAFVKPIDLPPQEQWAAAIERAGAILGLAISPLLNASNVAALSSGAKKRAGELRAACQSYGQRLRERLEKAWPPARRHRPPGDGHRGLATGRKAARGARNRDRRRAGDGRVATSESAMGECLVKAPGLAATLDGTNWEIFEAIGRLNDSEPPRRARFGREVEQVLHCDEHVKPLAAVLKEAQSKAVRLLVPPPSTPRPRLLHRRAGRSIDQATAKIPEHRRRQGEA